MSRYAKTHDCYFVNQQGQKLSVYGEYVLQLRGFSKRRSDPFCRSQRFRMTVGSAERPETVTTSVRQLNFLKWLGQTGILKFIFDNIEHLHAEYLKEKEMSKRGEIPPTMASEGEVPSYERTRMHRGTFELDFSV